MLLVTLYDTIVYIIPAINFLFASQKESSILREHFKKGGYDKHYNNGKMNFGGIIDERLKIDEIVEDVDLMLLAWDINDRSP